MEGLYKNKYRIASTRLPGWDYSSTGYYFITICAKNYEHLFGTIHNEKMCLYHSASIAWNYWFEIPNHFHHVYIDAFIVMPNHVHGIIHIDHGDATQYDTCNSCKRWYKNRYAPLSSDIISANHVQTGHCPVSTTDNAFATDDAQKMPFNCAGNNALLSSNDIYFNHVETGHCPVSTTDGVFTSYKSSKTHGSISSIIGSYKSIVTKSINQLFYKHHIQQTFTWQPRYYDSIIRDERALHNIRRYIHDNPKKWHHDRNNTQHIYA